MSKLDFSPGEFASRHHRVRDRMQQEGLDVLLVIHPANIQYLIGSRTKSYQEFQVLLFFGDERPMHVLTRLSEVAEFERESLAQDVVGWGGRVNEDPVDVFSRWAKHRGVLGCRVGLEVPHYYVHPSTVERMRAALIGCTVTDASLLVHDLKLVKSPAELAYIRHANDIADRAMDSCIDAISEGASELEIAGEVYRTLLREGGDLPASPMNFVSGERTCYGHGAPSARRLGPQDLMHIEFGAAVKRYTATIGRQFCLGTPTARMREVYKVVLEACDACIEAAKPGVRTTVPHEAAKQVIADAGLDEYRVHTTGYGLAPGYPPSWGEGIHFFDGSSYTLLEGMVLSVEPPVLIPEENIGFRIIDNVVISADGAKLLSRHSRDLIIL